MLYNKALFKYQGQYEAYRNLQNNEKFMSNQAKSFSTPNDDNPPPPS